MDNDNKIIITQDGSDSLHSKLFNENYHSVFGAVQESNHIFIDAVLKPVSKNSNEVKIFEVGFGTGLNALLTYNFSLKNRLKIEYHSVEAYPISLEVAKSLNYPGILNIDKPIFLKMHLANDNETKISENFTLKVFHSKLQETELPEEYYDCIYFDAFSPETQPELWKQSCFDKLYKALKPEGLLSTYSSKGVVKRALRAAGFKVKRLPGPPGKREFLIAIKNDN